MATGTLTGSTIAATYKSLLKVRHYIIRRILWQL